jgi:arginyl-tRNA synthetase
MLSPPPGHGPASVKPKSKENMNLFAEIRTWSATRLLQMQAEGDLPDGLIDQCRGRAAARCRPWRHGDQCRDGAGQARRAKPRDIAEALAGAGRRSAHRPAEVAGPGFLNLRLAPDDVWQARSRRSWRGPRFRARDDGAGQRVNVEYVSANPTGPLHVGHTRGAVFGDALASLLDFAGYDVTREYYINDGGAQVDVLARSVYLRYLEACGQPPRSPRGTYPGDYLIPVGEALKDKVGDAYLGKPEAVWLAEIRDFATDAMMDLIREDLAALGVEMDVFYSRKIALRHGPDRGALDDLDRQGPDLRRRAGAAQGQDARGLGAARTDLFRSTEHGDDVDRPVKKSDGSLDLFRPRHRLSL